ncbi:replicative DNA helicase [bacterium endosymbiont of Escarpia laminata]|nr:MAG: replicative DNA helicase [bacterium endosymbiont of Escarpia laminata]
MAWANIEAEQAVLGGLMLDNSSWDRVTGKVSANDFSRRNHQLIFSAITNSAQANQPFDVVTLAEHLEQTERLGQAGGLPYLVNLVEDAFSAANVGVYASIVREKAKRRTLRDLFLDATRDAEHGDLDDLLSDVTTRAEATASHGGGSLTFTEAFTRTLDHIDKAAAARQNGGVVGIPTGLPGIDRRTGGLQQKRLIVLAARPSIGKTALANQIAIHAATRGYPVGIVSLEMGAEELTIRAMAHCYRLNFSGLAYGDDEECTRLTDAMTEKPPISSLPIYIDTDTTTLGGITARMAEWKRQHGIALCIVDHIGLVEGGDDKTRNDWLGKISRSLKLTAKRLDLPILAVSQLNRSVERDKRRPVLADLRDSGNIEQDADVCAFLHVDGNAVETTYGLPMEIGLLKNRTGQRGWLPEEFTFDGRTQTFLEIEQPIRRFA